MPEGRRSEALLSWVKEIQIILRVEKPELRKIINVRGPEVRGIVKLSQGNSDYFACCKAWVALILNVRGPEVRGIVKLS